LGSRKNRALRGRHLPTRLEKAEWDLTYRPDRPEVTGNSLRTGEKTGDGTAERKKGRAGTANQTCQELGKREGSDAPGPVGRGRNCGEKSVPKPAAGRGYMVGPR